MIQPGDIPSPKLLPIMEELVARCGTDRLAAEYAGVSRATLMRIRHEKHPGVEPKVARLLILALYQRRKEDRRNGSSERFRRARMEQARIQERMERLAGY